MKTLHTICSECWREVDATFVVEHEIAEVRGVPLEGDFEHLVCPECGERIGQLEVAGRNLEKLYRAYRDKLDIPQPEELVKLRKQYKFSQRVMAAVLGIGVASLQRYERGNLATDAHAELLRSMRDPRFVRRRLLARPKGLTEEECEKALASIAHLPARVEYEIIHFDLLEDVMRAKTEETGQRIFDPDRVRETIVYLAAHVHDLYRTKLNKVLFYLDFASFREVGVGFTGMRYAKADYGPVPDHYELILVAFLDNQALSLREKGEGQIVVAQREANLSKFSEAEVQLLDAVCAFANTFKTASALSKYSHQEPGWLETPTGSTISYTYANQLQWHVSNRIAT